MIKLNYEKLVDDYEKSIDNVLRGFKPGEDFLELWVPDDDHNRSIVNLVESAQACGLVSLELNLSKKTADTLDMNELKQELESLCELKISNTSDEVALTLKNLNEGSEQDSSVDNNQDEDLELYLAQCEHYAMRAKHEGSVEDDDDLLLIRGSFEGISLFMAVDTEKHMIRKVAYSGANDQVLKGMLEALCDIIENTPIQDAAEHGILKLEWALRDHTKRNEVKGIRNIFNYPKKFNIPLKLIRDLYDTYTDKTDFKRKQNFWDGLTPKEWRTLDQDQRINTIQKQINDLLKDNELNIGEITVTGIEKAVKANVSFDESVPNFKKAKIMLMLEKLLRQKFEVKIELYQSAWKDRNKLRRL